MEIIFLLFLTCGKLIYDAVKEREADRYAERHVRRYKE